jgi:Spy/CpxP family protein refolding chaperone
MKLLLSSLLLLPVLLPAQPPRAYFPWWDGKLVADLNLSTEQREKIRSILREHRNKLIDERAAVEKAEAEVEDLFGESELDESRAQPAIDRLVEARSALTRSFTEMGLKLRRVLTTEQWKELQQRRSRADRPFGRRPRGGGDPKPAGSGPEPKYQPHQ